MRAAAQYYDARCWRSRIRMDSLVALTDGVPTAVTGVTWS